MPIRIDGIADGTSYRPSNGTEGMMFEEQICSKCKKYTDYGPCKIFDLSMLYNLKDPEYPKEWIFKNETPVCTAFE